MARGKRWTTADRTGGPFDLVVAAVRRIAPSAVVEQLVGTHPADDDNVFWFGPTDNPGRVQVDTRPQGRPPFLIEAEQRFVTDDPAEAASIILAWFGPSPPPAHPYRNVRASDGGPHSCPCCGHRTLPERGAYDLCPECHWEDDGQDDHDADEIREGPNGTQSLTAARLAYARAGGTPRPHRPPTDPA